MPYVVTVAWVGGLLILQCVHIAEKWYKSKIAYLNLLYAQSSTYCMINPRYKLKIAYLNYFILCPIIDVTWLILHCYRHNHIWYCTWMIACTCSITHSWIDFGYHPIIIKLSIIINWNSCAQLYWNYIRLDEWTSMSIIKLLLNLITCLLLLNLQ